MGKLSLLNVGSQQYSKELHDDEYQLEKHFASQPEALTQNLVYMGAQLSNQFPLTLLTEGGLGGLKVEYIKGDEYDYPVMDNVNTMAATITKTVYTGADKPGIGGSSFVIFTEQTLIPTYEYLLNTNMKAYCREVKEEGTSFKGTFVLVDQTNPDKFVPISALEEGKKIARVVSINSKAGSRGNGSVFVSPYKRKNMINTFRKTYRFEGEIPSKVVTFNYKTSSNEQKTLWMDYRKWVFYQEWNMEKELGLWEGEYNKDESGRIQLKDRHSGNVVQRGSGLFEQITNRDSYGVLTGRKLKSILRDVFRPNGDATPKNVTVFGGTIAGDNFDSAMKEMLKTDMPYATSIGDKFVFGSDGEMGIGGYFTKYKTPEGMITFVKSDMFDRGPRAIVADAYMDGYSMESGRMVFIDNTSYNGESNLKMIIKKGMEDYKAKVAGVGTQLDGSQPEYVSSDVHASSVEHMTMRGVQIMRATNCFDLEFRG